MIIALIFTVSNTAFFLLALWLGKWFERDRQRLRSYASYGMAGILGGCAVLSLMDVIRSFM